MTCVTLRAELTRRGLHQGDLQLPGEGNRSRVVRIERVGEQWEVCYTWRPLSSDGAGGMHLHIDTPLVLAHQREFAADKEPEACLYAVELVEALRASRVAQGLTSPRKLRKRLKQIGVHPRHIRSNYAFGFFFARDGYGIDEQPNGVIVEAWERGEKIPEPVYVAQTMAEALGFLAEAPLELYGCEPPDLKVGA